jgi:cell division protein FtsL
MKNIAVLFMVAALIFGCTSTSKKESKMEVNQEIMKKAGEFASFTLTTDLTVLTEKERQMLPILLEAAQLMDEIFWKEAFGL